MASHAEESHLRVLLKPCVNLSIHTASDVRLPTLKNRQWGKSVGLARRTRANHCLAPLERPRRRLNFHRAQRIRIARMGCADKFAPSTCRTRSAGTDSPAVDLSPHLAAFPPSAARRCRPPSVRAPSASVRCRATPRDTPYDRSFRPCLPKRLEHAQRVLNGNL